MLRFLMLALCSSNRYDPIEDTETLVARAPLKIKRRSNRYDPIEDTETGGFEMNKVLIFLFQPLRSNRGY